jgi:hypothetical protein
MFGKKKNDKENQTKKSGSFLEQILKNDTEFETIGQTRSQSTPIVISDSPLPNGEIKAKKKRSFFGFMTKDDNLNSPSVETQEHNSGEFEKKRNWRSGTIMGFTSPIFSKKKEESVNDDEHTIEVETIAINEELQHEKKRSPTIFGFNLDLSKNDHGNSSTRQDGILSPTGMLTSPKEFKKSPKIVVTVVEEFNRFENPMYSHLINLKNDALMFPDMNQKEENPFPSVYEYVSSSERNHGIFERNFEFCETRVNVKLFTQVKEVPIDVNDLLRIIPNIKKKLYHTPPSIATFIDSFSFKKIVEFDKKSIESTNDMLVAFDNLLNQSKFLFQENMPNINVETLEIVPFLSVNLQLTEQDLNPRDKSKMFEIVENTKFVKKKQRQHTILNSVDVTISRVIESFLDHEINLPDAKEPLEYIESVNDLLMEEEYYFEQSLNLYFAGNPNVDRDTFEKVDFLCNALELDLNDEELIPRDVNQFKDQQIKDTKKRKRSIVTAFDPSISKAMKSFSQHEVVFQTFDFMTVNEQILWINNCVTKSISLFESKEPNFNESFQ